MSDRINIVQAHLGPEVPRHIYAQMRQTRVFNPDTPLYLILSSGADYDKRAVDEVGAIIVRKESLRKCRSHRRFLRRNRLNRRSLGGFWLFASERFFAIESFLEACRLENVVHVENDVMLYVDLDHCLPALGTRCPRIGITMDSDTRCVPGFVFIRDPEALAVMDDFIVREALKKTKNDMRALALFMNRMAPDACSALPVIPPSYRSLWPLVNAQGENAERPWYDEAFDAFGGVFDAAALGQFLGGVDSKVSDRDTVGFVSETAVYDPRRMGLSWKQERGSWRPYGKVGDTEFPIFNLHVHSKRLEDFSSARLAPPAAVSSS